MVDWDLAGRTARRLMSAGPSTTREEAAAVVREGVGFAVAGTAIGRGGALIAGTLLETQLYALDATDPVSFAAVWRRS